jgi:hypothetical protein
VVGVVVGVVGFVVTVGFVVGVVRRVVGVFTTTEGGTSVGTVSPGNTPGAVPVRPFSVMNAPLRAHASPGSGNGSAGTPASAAFM